MNVGDKVVGIYGATIPYAYGEVVKVKDTEVDVQWENGSVSEMMDTDIRNEKALERALMGTQIGSPIGVYLANDLEIV